MTASASPMGCLAFDSAAGVPCWIGDDGGSVLAFSTRLGGVSTAPYDSLNLGRSTADDPAAVAENRRRLLECLGLDPGRLATASQTHGVRVERARDGVLHLDCDALVTTEPGLAIAVTAADCLPIICIAPDAVAVAHSGWRGTVAGMPRAVLEAVCAASGCGTERVHAYLGPSIRSCCYRVGPDVADSFPAAARLRKNGSWHVDLAAFARIQLMEAGALPEHVADLAECTACDPARYFSHRRDAGLTGRLWAVAARRHTGIRRRVHSGDGV